MIHPYNNPQVIAGAGTTAYELIKEVGELDALFVPVGGGGLVSGCSIVTKKLSPKTKVFAAEPEGANDAYRSFKAKQLFPSVSPKTIADGLLISLAEITFNIIQKNVYDIITVSDEEIIRAMRLLWERMKLVVEPSGAVSLASTLKYCTEHSDLRVGVVISGGNIDLSSFFEQYELDS